MKEASRLPNTACQIRAMGTLLDAMISDRLTSDPTQALARPIRPPSRQALWIALGAVLLAHAILISVLFNARVHVVPPPAERATQLIFESPAPPPLRALPPPAPLPAPSMPVSPPEALPETDALPDVGVPPKIVSSRPANIPRQRLAAPATSHALPHVPAYIPLPANAPTEAGDGARRNAPAPNCAAQTPPYPASAQVMHETGMAVVSLVVAPGGGVAKVEIVTSSGYDDLDDAAVAAARSARCVNDGGQSATLRLPVHFRMD
ncbi:TonB family protein [Neoasaia chiangmaiensis]|nr:TonB family protein [Neoasaia chiangmaiensis]